MFDVAQSTANNDGGHSIIASFLPLTDLDVSSWPALTAAPTTNALTLTLEAGDIDAVSGKKWVKISTQTEMIGADIGSEGSVGSISMVGSPKVRFNNCTGEELGFINSKKNVPGLMVLKDRAGVQWLYGSPDFPCYLSEASGSFGTNNADDKFAEFTLRSIDLPKIYTGAISYIVVV
jgi:hypothetical protein